MVLHSYIQISSNWDKFYIITWKELLADSLRFNGRYDICYAKCLSLGVTERPQQVAIRRFQSLPRSLGRSMHSIHAY